MEGMITGTKGKQSLGLCSCSIVLGIWRDENRVEDEDEGRGGERELTP
jgi:hypothetical protein